MGIVMIMSPLLLALMLPLLVLSSSVEPEHVMNGKNSVSCPGETGPGCRCDIYNGEFFCDEASEKCCNVDGNTFCAPLWQSCFQSEHQETELRQDCPDRQVLAAGVMDTPALMMELNTAATGTETISVCQHGKTVIEKLFFLFKIFFNNIQ